MLAHELCQIIKIWNVNKLCHFFWINQGQRFWNMQKFGLKRQIRKAIRRNCLKLQPTSGQLILHNSTVLWGKVNQAFRLILIVPDECVPDAGIGVSTEGQRAVLLEPGSSCLCAAPEWLPMAGVPSLLLLMAGQWRMDALPDQRTAFTLRRSPQCYCQCCWLPGKRSQYTAFLRSLLCPVLGHCTD